MQLFTIPSQNGARPIALLATPAKKNENARLARAICATNSHNKRRQAQKISMSEEAKTARQPTRRDLANAIRALSMDAVQAANSGHPGAPMGMADIAEVLWNDYLKHNPGNPRWPNRDRFVLSNGHGSMLLYSLLHLTGYDVSIDELRKFRQFGERTAGHPEYEPEMGVETTTGPLGQGVTNAVGMALAEKMLAAEFNRDRFPVVDHRTWVFLGDGCIMEGISHEACSLAGTLKLGKLICLYDDNNISIDGEVDGWFTDDTAARFDAYGWQVIRDVDGHDSAAIAAALPWAIESSMVSGPVAEPATKTPALMASIMRGFSASVVTMMMGVALSVSRTFLTMVRPSMLGMFQSTSIMSKGPLSAIALRASRPSPASTASTVRP